MLTANIFPSRKVVMYMPHIKPFKAIRPAAEVVEKVAAPPYDVIDSREVREMVRDNPYSFLRVGRAEVELEPGIDAHDGRVYQRARENFRQMLATGVLIPDQKENFYIYRLSRGEQAQTGLVACVSVDDYLNNIIKKHEHTRPDKEQDRAAHIEACNAQTGPIFLTYRHREDIAGIMKEWMADNPPLYDFVAPDGVGHRAWLVGDGETLGQLIAAFGKLKYFYIADGHHRTAAAARVALRRREQDPDYSGGEEYNYFLSVLFPHTELMIMDYNRVVADLKGLSPAAFREKIAKKFTVELSPGQGPYRPHKKGTFGMYLGGAWYRLQAKAEILASSDPIGSLDVSLLQDNILGPILGIEDPRTDDRIDFVGGSRGLEELAGRGNGGMAVAFSLYPTSITDVMGVADLGLVMPPKSTWFEPKLLSGLFIHSL